METPVQIDFRACDNADGFRARIEDQVAQLEAHFGRITACRVVVHGPGDHHQKGGHFEVGVHLMLPDGRTVDVDREPLQDERYGDAWFAINDSFRRTRRILQDNVARMRGDVKEHQHAPIATVMLLRPQQGYGFLETDDGREIYFHENSVLHSGFSRLTPGARVAFIEDTGDKGPQASMVRIIN